ncbi:ferric ABC transporter ATP-binding protein [Brenneria corticis]|uniref:Ferric ABC transporter ATP-binding protein n=1 Tax=Brenneria corticis TaxID=2173106 RepID=A0A2U1TYJ0_9GAMM|nr:ferric ABC transporter ATP-binding protein [Brenneria sp. CFCC 11842]PWC14454.1 ferric ABC transporter ATP-binding protein [Brenneria sp. CFCC 11842]
MNTVNQQATATSFNAGPQGARHKNFVELKHVTKRFGHNTVIDDLNLAIPQGKMVTLLGPSGCGKTTVLRLVAGLEKPTEGRILIDDEDVTERSIQQRDICMVFQSYALFPHMSLGENIGYGLKMLGRPKAEINQRVKEALALVDLDGFADRFVDQISGGQQQRVALARALILKPKVLLFDEPLSNLDANLRRSMREKIRELQQQFNITSLYVTHDQSEAFAVSDMVLVMNKGKIMQLGAPQELYRQPASHFMASFMGDANIFPAAIADDSVAIYGYKLPRPPGFAAGAGECTVGVRPEAITLGLQGEESQRCTITQVAYMGPQYEVQVEWHGQSLLLQVNATQLQPNPGDSYFLQIHPYGMFVLADNEPANK